MTSYLSSTADAYSIEQSEELLSLSCGDDCLGRRAVIGILLPAPHHQLPQQYCALQVLAGGERGERGGERGGGREGGGERGERGGGGEGGGERGGERADQLVRVASNEASADRTG